MPPHVPRLYVRRPITPGTVVLDAEQSRRIGSVLRLRRGDAFLLFCGDGREWRAEVLDDARSGVRARVVDLARQEPRPALSLEVWCALVRPNRFDLVVEKCTEAGADVIRPLVTEHSARGDEPSATRTARWERLVVEASEQGGRLYLPAVSEPQHFGEAVRRLRHPLVVADPGGMPWSEAAALLPESGTLAVAVGPEGGWNESELAAARAGGSILATVSPNVLRTETAAILLAGLVRASR
jgi:16S rRNA (uracil1498-N3)-methyltransferase